MRVAYVHLPRFPVQRRVRETPSLTGQPFVLHEEVRGQRRVAFGSTAVLKQGVRAGMTLTAASALCPSLTHFPYVAAAEDAALMSLGEALMAVAPAFQLSAPDGLWLDPSAARLYGGEEGLLHRVIELTAAHGYRAHAVVTSDLFSARTLGRYGETRLRVVASNESASALAPLPLQALEDSEAGTLPAFSGLGLRTLGEVASLPAGAVVARLGAEGLRTHRLCRGEDDSRFVPQALPEEVEERIDLDWPAESMEPLLFALKTTLDRICARLSGRRRAAVRLTFTLKLDPSGDASVALSLARPSAQSKLLLDLAKHRLEDLTLPNPISALVVRVDESCEDRGQQLSLGDEPQGDAALEVVLSRLHTTLGEDALFAAELEGVHRPESAYARRAFRPPEREGGMLAEAARHATGTDRVEQQEEVPEEAKTAASGEEAKVVELRPRAVPEQASFDADWVDPPSPWGDPEPWVAARAASKGGASARGRVERSRVRVESPRVGATGSWGGEAGSQPGATDARAEDAPVEAGAEGSRAGTDGFPEWMDGSVWDRPRRKVPPPSSEPDLSGLERPVRCFSAPATLDAELGTQGELLGARLLGRRRKATAVAGPERLSGEWWSEDPFARDYYRVHFEGLGPVWIYRDSRDGRFYLQGMFD